MIRQKINVDAKIDLGGLAGRVSSGALVLGVGSGVYAVVNIVSAILLARLLGPDEFGLVAMVTSFTCFVQVLKDGGLSAVTVQKERLRDQEVSNLFWINVLFGACGTVLVCLLSPVMVWFYQRDELLIVTVTLSSCFFIGGIGVQHRALLSRLMRFRSLALINVLSVVSGSLVGIAIAFRGHGVWALVAMQVSTAVVEVACLWYCAGWLPKWPMREEGLLGSLRFGSAVAIRRSLRQIERMGGYIVLGRFIDASAVGAYSRGFALIVRPLDQLMAPIGGVFIPTLSRMQGDPDRFNAVFRRACSVIGLGLFPLSGICLATGDSIAVWLLGPKWLAAGEVFRALGGCFISIPVGYVIMWPLIAHARTRAIIAVGIVAAGVSALAFGSGVVYGAQGVAWAYSISSLVLILPIQFAIVGRRGPVTAKNLWGVMWSYCPLAVVAFVGASIGSRSVLDHDIGIVASCGCLGGVAAASLFVLSMPARRREVIYLVRVIVGAVARFMVGGKNE